MRSCSDISRVLYQFRWLLPSVVLLACTPLENDRGFVSDEDIAARITANSTTKEDVFRMFGSPSSTSNFGADTWYYISSHKQAVAFLKPEVVEQRVVRVEFDESGVVRKVERFGKEDAREIEVIKRTTPTEGHTLGFFEQMVGNIGRYNKDKDKSPAAPKHKPPI